MYVLCSATERQHSTKTGAYMWLPGFHGGESFHWLSFVLRLLPIIMQVQTNVRAI